MRKPFLTVETLVVDGFIPTEIGSVLDVVRIANRHAGRTVLEIALRGVGPAASVVSRDGHLTLKLDAQDVASAAPDIMITAGGRGVLDAANSLIKLISRRLRQGSRVILLSDAATAWANANKTLSHFTTHWEDRIALLECRPDPSIGTSLYSGHMNPTTSAGMAATADTLLEVIRTLLPEQLSSEVARSLIMERIRPGETPQPVQMSDKPEFHHPVLRAAVVFIEANLDQPITGRELRKAVGASSRQLERIFKTYLGESPMHFLKSCRLRRARLLLETTQMQIIDVAIASGFPTQASLAKNFRNRFGLAPRQYRAQFFGTAAAGPASV